MISNIMKFCHKLFAINFALNLFEHIKLRAQMHFYFHIYKLYKLYYLKLNYLSNATIYV